VPEAGTEVEPMLQLTVASEHVSDAVTQYGAETPEQEVAARVCEAGRVSVGLVVSWTVTEKLHCAVCLQESVAEQVTVVEGMLNESPDCAEHVYWQPVEVTGAAQVAGALPAPLHSTTTSDPQVMVGEGGGVTVTVNEPDAWLPATSVAVHETVVVPTGKV